MRGRSLAPLLALLCSLAACAPNNAGDAAPVGGNLGGGEESSDSAAAEEADRAVDSAEAQSLDEFFGWTSGNPADQEAAFRDRESRIQEAIRRCMAEQGFEYRPVGPPEDAVEVMDESAREEWVRTRGFGITTWYGKEGEVGPTPALSDSGPGGVVVEEWVDPNLEMLDAMTEVERRAWEDELYGPREEQEADMGVHIDEETGETVMHSPGFGAGCQGAAYEAEYGDQSQVEALWEELQPAMEEMDQRIEADPRIVDANSDWSLCMGEAGHEFSSRQQMHDTIYEDFQQRLEELVGPNMGAADPFEGWTQEEIDAFRAQKTPEEIESFIAQAQGRGDVDLEAVAALQQDEIDLALADLGCGKHLQDVYAEVRAEFESEFITANRDTVEQIREAQGD